MRSGLSNKWYSSNSLNWNAHITNSVKRTHSSNLWLMNGLTRRDAYTDRYRRHYFILHIDNLKTQWNKFIVICQGRFSESILRHKHCNAPPSSPDLTVSSNCCVHVCLSRIQLPLDLDLQSHDDDDDTKRTQTCICLFAICYISFSGIDLSIFFNIYLFMVKLYI